MLLQKTLVRLPGLLVVLCLAAVAIALSLILRGAGVTASPLVVALILGLVLARPLPARPLLSPGLAFACRPVLRFAIILLGLRIGAHEVTSFGVEGWIAICFVVVGTMVATVLICRWLGLSNDLGWLLACGHSICGAAAVAAADSVLKTKAEDAALALSLVTLMGTVAMLLCPVLGRLFELSPATYGFWVGGSVHEVAQAVAAGYALGTPTGEAASIAKLARVAFLLPLGLFLSGIASRRASVTGSRLIVPWFVVGFAVVALWNGTGTVPESLARILNDLCTLLMTMAMGALGLNTRLAGMTAAGWRPLVAAGLATVVVSVLGFVCAP